MSKVSRSITIDAPPEAVFDVISDFENYPEFLQEVEDAAIEKKSAREIVVSFVMNMIKRVRLTLSFKLSRPAKISWSLISGDMMKYNNGSWVLKKLPSQKTKVTYSVDIGLGLFVPDSVANLLIEKNLPEMLENFKNRIEGR